MPQFQDGIPHDLSAGTNGSTYLYRTVKAPKDMTLTGYFGSDDGMRAWLNGKLLVSNDVPRGHSPNQDIAKLALKAGENHLLLKIFNNGGGHGFFFSTSPNPVGGGGRNDPRQAVRDEVWRLLGRDFREGSASREMSWERQDSIWTEDWTRGDFASLAQRYVRATRTGAMAAEAKKLADATRDAAGLGAVREVYYRSRKLDEAGALVRNFNFAALRLAINDLAESFPDKYTKAKDFLARVDALEKQTQEIIEKSSKGDPAANERLAKIGESLATLRAEALLANPLLDFDKLLVVKRSVRNLGLPQNWQGNCAIARSGYDNEIATLSPVSPQGKLAALYRPDKGQFVGDVDLHWNAERMLFSSNDAKGRWQVFEIKADGTGLRQVTPGDQPDVDNYDACYLPNGKIIFDSTACFHGVPCVGGGNTVANLYLLDTDGKSIRRLCFEQDHDWCPTVLNNGRVLYARWEYSDSPHYFTRLLFHMNPDGTEQLEYSFSNSYWPNSIFYARPIPEHPSKVVGIISGHHGVPRMGELVVFDPARGRHESDGALQRIPGYGKPVPPTIADGLVEGSWPKFLHPYPLSGKYFLVSCKPSANANWGIYLVDIFDNMLPIAEAEGYALFEPVPLRKTPTPPAIPEKVDPRRKDANVFLADVYMGEGLRGVPRGTVKKLRVYAFHYTYPGIGGHIHIGIDGPWDVHRILGTVPVYEDGSAYFRVPANTPLAVQPLDEKGRALQVMRSWYTAMPGENATCIGCHERQNTTPPNRRPIAALKAPVDIEPWYGPTRGLSFPRDVQPVLDKFCVGCHDGSPAPNGKPRPDLRAKKEKGPRGFDQSYLALHPYVRRPGPESDYHLQKPLEWHASTSELVQMLEKGHHGVKLDAEAWDRLTTWIDLNVPDHGTWGEHHPVPGKGRQRRNELNKLYANLDEDPEAIPELNREPIRFVAPDPEPPTPNPQPPAVDGWPFDAVEARRRQAAAGAPTELKIELGNGLTMELVLIPPGEFVMGDIAGFRDEGPLTRLRIQRAFYMARLEITNEIFALFDPNHDSGVISVFNKDQSTRGEAANRPRQPVIRISWQQAMAFCYWLSQRTGRRFTLPTEAQWEYACRAGTATPLNFGACDADFSRFANLADQRVWALCRGDSPKWIPAIAAANDGAIISDTVGRYQPNAWGLCDMHGNVCEWTLTTYRPYPYVFTDGRDDPATEGRKVVRGGSWYDRPHRARSAFRLAYPAWQRVYNVGFRVVCDLDAKKLVSADR